VGDGGRFAMFRQGLFVYLCRGRVADRKNKVQGSENNSIKYKNEDAHQEKRMDLNIWPSGRRRVMRSDVEVVS